jgi:hypothetical protein
MSYKNLKSPAHYDHVWQVIHRFLSAVIYIIKNTVRWAYTLTKTLVNLRSISAVSRGMGCFSRGFSPRMEARIVDLGPNVPVPTIETGRDLKPPFSVALSCPESPLAIVLPMVTNTANSKIYHLTLQAFYLHTKY